MQFFIEEQFQRIKFVIILIGPIIDIATFHILNGPWATDDGRVIIICFIIIYFIIIYYILLIVITAACYQQSHCQHHQSCFYK